MFGRKKDSAKSPTNDSAKETGKSARPPQQEANDKSEEEEKEHKKLENKGRATFSDYVQIYMIEVEVKKAEDLIKADVFGLSDPYCEVIMFGQTYRTKTIMKNLYPVWNEKTVFAFFEDPEIIQFRVWDWDKGSKDDPIGDCKLSLQNFFDQGHNGFDGKIKLENVKKGELFVKVKCKKLVPSDLEERCRNLRNDIENQNQKFNEQQSTINDLINKNNNITKQNNEIQEENNKLENKKKSLQSDMEGLRYSEKEYSTQLQNLETQRSEVDKEYKDSENVKNSKNTKLTTLKNDVDKLDHEIKHQLGDELQNMKKQYQSKQENEKTKAALETTSAKKSTKDDFNEPLTVTATTNTNAGASACNCCIVM